MNTEEQFDHLMIDIETLGNTSNSVIVSLAAVEFDINTGRHRKIFYETIDIDSCLNAGLKVNGSTIRWWMDKSQEARNEVAKGGKHLNQVLYSFSEFVRNLNNPHLQVWSRGLRFDIALLSDAYNTNQTKTPWEFRGERDVRTLEALRPAIYKQVIAEKRSAHAEHLAVEDCLIQINYCSKIWQSINIGTQIASGESVILTA